MRSSFTATVAGCLALGIYTIPAFAQQVPTTPPITPPTTSTTPPTDSIQTINPVVPPTATLQLNPPTRWGAKLGILGVTGPVYSPSNAIYRDGSWPFVSGGVSYRLQSPGKRTLFQPEVYMDMGANPAFAGPDTQINAGYPEGHAYIGMGLSERTSLYLMGQTAVYFGGGVGIYETTSFHLENDSEGPNDPEPYSTVADYSCARLGFKVFAGLQFHKGFFTEASYQNLGSADSYRYRSAGLFFGYRR